RKNGVVRKDYLDFLRELRKSKDSPYGELALHPEIQTKTRTEIETVQGKYQGELSYQVLAECEYLDNVVFESLRRNPIILYMSRICTEEYKFSSARGPGTGKEVIIEKGTQIFIPVYGIHRDSHYYPDPDRFDPLRFIEEEKAARPK
ncbi:hypothetical protein ILUMI_04409, partial [Ignelater luminosus]